MKKIRMNQAKLLLAVLLAPALLTSCGGGGTSTPEPGAVQTREADGAEMVWVPGGEFTVGLTEADVDAVMTGCSNCPRDRVDNACPQHTVHLDGFWIDRREVSNGQYRRCIEAGACTLPAHTKAYDDPAQADDPVTAITWYQAVDYARWVGGRLPTEVEWEAACAGPYGLDGTAGEVWEWTSSLHRLYPYDATDGREDPDVPRMRTVRGAAWIFDPDVERCAFRFYSPQDIFSDQIGLRVAVFPPP
ncbi:MAG: formylglycine-generating enzyme family protein [Anaerolineae bacterium]